MADVNYGVGMRRKVEKAQMRSVIILRTDRKLAGIEDDFLPTYGVLALPYLPLGTERSTARPGGPMLKTLGPSRSEIGGWFCWLAGLAPPCLSLSLSPTSSSTISSFFTPYSSWYPM